MHIKRISRLSLIVIFSFFCVALSVAQNLEIEKPNIILIMTDDQGWSDVGFNGNNVIQTPNLDLLASNGVVLDRFYSASAVCSPTRASLITGRNPLRMDIPYANAGHLKKEEITISEILKGEGYSAGHFGKWHLGTLTKSVLDANRGGQEKFYKDYTIPSEHGYDTFFCTESKTPTYDPMVYPAKFIKGESKRYGWRAVEKYNSANTFDTFYWKGESQKDTANLRGDDSRVIMDRVIPFIENSIKKDQPFFTTIWFHTPHLPVVSDSLHRSMYGELDFDQQLYYGTITAMDEQVGRLWEKLKASGVEEETIIFFCSDNGPEINTPGSAGVFRGRKRSLYEGGVRVPAFVVWKGNLAGGRRINFPSVTSDYMPTILDILEVKYPDERPVDGLSILNTLKGSEKEREKPIGFICRPFISWVTHRYKLIGDENIENFELFDLLIDKSEEENIIEEFPEVAEKLKVDLTEWLNSVENSKKGMDYNVTNTDVFVSPLGSNDNVGTKEMPVQTITKAFEKALKIRNSSNERIFIHLMEGDYHLLAPLVITSKLSNISILGEGSDKVSIKGSKALNAEWGIFNKNIWVADIKDDIDFNQLFINGEKQILARYPNYDENGGYWQGSASDVIAKERVATWKNPVGGFVHAMHKGRWGGFHYEITSVNENGEVDLIGGHQNNRPSTMHPELRMVENVFEELDSENEWYFDKEKKKLYLWAGSTVDLNAATVEVSVLKHLIEVNGTQENPVTNVHIEGIRFEHAMRTFMEEYHQLLRSDWTIYRGGAIFLNGTESCSINDCEFTDLGGNVIFVNGYNRNTEIIGNHIHHCGASAISFVGDSTSVRSPSYQYSETVPIRQMDTIQGPLNDLYPEACKVENNLIHKIGRIEKQVAGVQLSMSMKIHVKNNSIYDVPRAGINVSEGTWGGHVIEYNDVFNTVLETGDHGSFNSWGRDRFWYPNRKVSDSLVHANPQMPYWDAVHATIIRNNRFRCDHGWDIDLDDGSSNYHIYNNLCLNGGIKLREGYYRLVENNITVNNGFHPHVWFDNSEDVFRKNIMGTKHFPIRLKGWGKEVDYNLFPDSISLALAHKNDTDENSVYGNPMFRNPEIGDFTVEENSHAFKIGFENFPMDNFGVQKPELKAIAKQPDFPELNIASFQRVKKSTKEWLGGTLKNIESLEAQSSFGLHSMDGIVVVEIKENSKLALSGITDGDVIVGIEGEKVKNISEMLIKYQEKLWHGSLKLSIIRNQKEREVHLNLQ